MSTVPPVTVADAALAPDWELDFYARPVLEPDGRKRWELLICSTPPATADNEADAGGTFRWLRACPASSVNSVWLREAMEEALEEAGRRGFQPPVRIRCWRGSMRTMVQRAAEGLGLDVVPSRRCYALLDWLREREDAVYPAEPGFLAGPMPPDPQPIQPRAVPLPEAARGDRWDWATLPLGDLAEAAGWDIGFAALLPIPAAEANGAQPMVPGVRLFSRHRALAVAGWLSGLEPARLEISGDQLVLEAGLEERWLLATLPQAEAEAAAGVFASARETLRGLQFLAVQSHGDQPGFEGFWILRDMTGG